VTDVSNTIKYIRDTSWTKDELMNENRRYFKSIAPTATIGFFIIDDSVLEKDGKPKHMEGLGWHYSHSKGKTVCGHCIVSSHYRYGDISFPYNFKTYRTESEAKKSKIQFKTKIDIARELIEGFKPFSNEKVYVLIDSWYTSKEILVSAKAKGCEVIGGLKSNRTFKLRENGPKHSLSAYARNARNASFDEITIDGVAYLVRRIECWISGAGNVAILISKRKKDGSRCFILSTDTSLSNEDIIRYYGNRWDIETGYLYCKDRLGMGHYQMRKMKAIEKYCALIFSAFCYLEALRLHNNQTSIGQSRRCFKLRRRREFVDRVASLVRRGMPLKKIYEELNIAA
jgi:SRSO17 transposase